MLPAGEAGPHGPASAALVQAIDEASLDGIQQALRAHGDLALATVPHEPLDAVRFFLQARPRAVGEGGVIDADGTTDMDGEDLSGFSFLCYLMVALCRAKTIRKRYTSLIEGFDVMVKTTPRTTLRAVRWGAGNTLLHLAALLALPQVVELLHAIDIDPEVRNAHGQLAADLAPDTLTRDIVCRHAVLDRTTGPTSRRWRSSTESAKPDPVRRLDPGSNGTHTGPTANAARSQASMGAGAETPTPPPPPSSSKADWSALAGVSAVRRSRFIAWDAQTGGITAAPADTAATSAAPRAAPSMTRTRSFRVDTSQGVQLSAGRGRQRSPTVSGGSPTLTPASPASRAQASMATSMSPSAGSGTEVPASAAEGVRMPSPPPPPPASSLGPVARTTEDRGGINHSRLGSVRDNPFLRADLNGSVVSLSGPSVSAAVTSPPTGAAVPAPSSPVKNSRFFKQMGSVMKSWRTPTLGSGLITSPSARRWEAGEKAPQPLDAASAKAPDVTAVAAAAVDTRPANAVPGAPLSSLGVRLFAPAPTFARVATTTTNVTMAPPPKSAPNAGDLRMASCPVHVDTDAVSAALSVDSQSPWSEEAPSALTAVSALAPMSAAAAPSMGLPASPSRDQEPLRETGDRSVTLADDACPVAPPAPHSTRDEAAPPVAAPLAPIRASSPLARREDDAPIAQPDATPPAAASGGASVAELAAIAVQNQQTDAVMDAVLGALLGGNVATVPVPAPVAVPAPAPAPEPFPPVAADRAADGSFHDARTEGVERAEGEDDTEGAAPEPDALLLRAAEAMSDPMSSVGSSCSEIHDIDPLPLSMASFQVQLADDSFLGSAVGFGHELLGSLGLDADAPLLLADAAARRLAEAPAADASVRSNATLLSDLGAGPHGRSASPPSSSAWSARSQLASMRSDDTLDLDARAPLPLKTVPAATASLPATPLPLENPAGRPARRLPRAAAMGDTMTDVSRKLSPFAQSLKSMFTTQRIPSPSAASRRPSGSGALGAGPGVAGGPMTSATARPALVPATRRSPPGGRAGPKKSVRFGVAWRSELERRRYILAHQPPSPVPPDTPFDPYVFVISLYDLQDSKMAWTEGSVLELYSGDSGIVKTLPLGDPHSPVPLNWSGQMPLSDLSHDFPITLRIRSPAAAAAGGDGADVDSGKPKQGKMAAMLQRSTLTRKRLSMRARSSRGSSSTVQLASSEHIAIPLNGTLIAASSLALAPLAETVDPQDVVLELRTAANEYAGRIVARATVMPMTAALFRVGVPSHVEAIEQGLNAYALAHETFQSGRMRQHGGDCASWRERHYVLTGARLDSFHPQTGEWKAAIAIRHVAAIRCRDHEAYQDTVLDMRIIAEGAGATDSNVTMSDGMRGRAACLGPLEPQDGEADLVLEFKDGRSIGFRCADAALLGEWILAIGGVQINLDEFETPPWVEHVPGIADWLAAHAAGKDDDDDSSDADAVDADAGDGIDAAAGVYGAARGAVSSAMNGRFLPMDDASTAHRALVR
ncbi:hypothetical protein CXG81DRAFT_16515 [Caulochytrium protostelioides]|uniref:Uncharacterized protein n=1 Tax=Caulochytrium protostelioides TaxID=1555241 RepID=A0A4P9XEU3_9FUNG|nr:hypothetical protein CXG81DRAFT_16515 [Caulochytrium protostelioides]|eukprot:RKP04095.1 hypothetical protein CXG81DRAFT_16515 [Caulochytrium protostelioides]